MNIKFERPTLHGLALRGLMVIFFFFLTWISIGACLCVGWSAATRLMYWS